MGIRKEYTQIKWCYGKKIDNPVETENIFSFIFYTGYSEDVFYGKKYGHKKFNPVKFTDCTQTQSRDCFQHYKNRTEQNHNKQDNIKSFARFGV